MTRVDLDHILQAGLMAAKPEAVLTGNWPHPPRGRLIVLAIGKAAIGMAAAAQLHYGTQISRGVIVARAGDMPTESLDFGANWLIHAAAHPVPDDISVKAAQSLFSAVETLSPDDLVLVLLSGGGSALTACPLDGLSLDALRQVTRDLLASGAPISAINIVRRQLSLCAGGRLAAAAAPAQVVTLAISDVPGDDPATIASGPTVPEPANSSDALDVLRRYGITPPDAIAEFFAHEQTVISTLPNAKYKVIASGATALNSMAEAAKNSGYDVLILGDAIEGEARETARVFAGIARAAAREQSERPLAILSGGETTVTRLPTAKEGGHGGRNSEYSLALAVALAETPGIIAAAIDSDGIDGHGGHAGAMVFPDTLPRARTARLDARNFLAMQDSARFFEQIGDLITTGPTGTNVNDLRVMLIDRRVSKSS